MKKLTKSDKVMIVVICVFVILVLAAFVAMTIVHAKNSTQTLCGYIRSNEQNGEEIRIVLQQKEGEGEYSQPIFRKTFSENCASKNLDPIVFSNKKGVSDYFYLVTLTNSEKSVQDYSIKLVQHGSNKPCCLSKQIEVSFSNGGEFEQTQQISGTLEKNATHAIQIRFHANLNELSAAPNGEFEILVETSHFQNDET